MAPWPVEIPCADAVPGRAPVRTRRGPRRRIWAEPWHHVARTVVPRRRPNSTTPGPTWFPPPGSTRFPSAAPCSHQVLLVP